METVAEPLGNLELFGGGVLGGLVGFATAIALPYVRELAEKAAAQRAAGKPTADLHPSTLEYVCIAAVLLVNVLLGGVAALLVGEATAIRQAIAFGLAWPAVLKGAGEGVLAVADLKNRSSGPDGDGANGTQ